MRSLPSRARRGGRHSARRPGCCARRGFSAQAPPPCRSRRRQGRWLAAPSQDANRRARQGRSRDRAVAIGSASAAFVRGRGSGTATTFRSGIDTSSAKPPGRGGMEMICRSAQQIRAAAQAGRAIHAAHQRVDRDPFACARPHGDDARRFMPEDQRRGASFVMAEEGVHVGAADAASVDPHQHIAGAWPWFGHLAKSEAFGGRIDESLHRLSYLPA